MAHITDIVSANIFAMEYKDEFKGQHYDVGTGDNISLNEVKDIVLEYHPDVVFEYRPPRSGDVLETKADITPLQAIGWFPSVSIEDGIRECFDFKS